MPQKWKMRNGKIVIVDEVKCYRCIDTTDGKSYYVDEKYNGLTDTAHDLIRRLPDQGEYLIGEKK